MSGQSGQSINPTVKLCIMRHGMAESTAPRDDLRELVDFGERQVNDTAHWFKRNYPSFTFDLALVSPYIRAQQTYNIVQKHLSVKKVERSHDIVPESDAPLTHDYLCALCNHDQESHPVNSILIVSHMPFVSLLAAEISTDNRAELFNTGAMAVMDCERVSMRSEFTQYYQSLF
jgi:phosphohistidine phosphatase